MENNEEIDINELLARINSNLEEGLTVNEKENCNENNMQIENKEEIKENNNNEKNEIKKTNIFTVVREKAEIIDENNEYLNFLERIKITNSLLTNEECNTFLIDTNKIQNIYETITNKYEKKLSAIAENQKKIFELTQKVKLSSINLNYGKDFPFLKMKNSDKDGKIKQIKILDQDAEKSKYYLLSIIHRLESLEFNLDKLIDYNNKIKK